MVTSLTQMPRVLSAISSYGCPSALSPPGANTNPLVMRLTQIPQYIQCNPPPNSNQPDSDPLMHSEHPVLLVQALPHHNW